ncbi:MAG: hypothetical protein ABIJ21_03130 [Nanoarchaeota archaeon]
MPKKNNFHFELWSLIMSLASLVGVLSFFIISLIGFPEKNFNFPENLLLTLNILLIVLLCLSYLFAIISIIQKIRHKKVDIWMVLVSLIINSQLIYIALVAMLSIGSTTGGSF